MYPRTATVTALAALFLFTAAGCVTSGGSGGGWVVVGEPASSPPPAAKKEPPPAKRKSNKGLETAARNHVRSAYRFLEKGKPDHAMRELEKARSKMGDSYWFHYYLGGAYFLKGMYQAADESWSMALGYTRDSRLGSRLRTCQSFAVHYTRGDEPSIGFLRMALDMDGENRQARELLDDLVGSGSGSDTQVGFQNAPGNKGKKGREKDEQGRGRSGKKEKKPKKIRDKDRFRAYFLVEMP